MQQTIQRTSLNSLRTPPVGANAAVPAKKPTMKEIAELPKQKQFPAMLEAFKTEIGMALPAHLNADRMARIALTCFRQNPTLAECEPASVFAAVVMASQLGLEPGLMGQAYLIPFNKKVKRNGREEWIKECQLIPGYQGLVDLARRSGRIRSLEAHVVYEHDTFECAFGIEPRLVHVPKWDGDRGRMRLAYAVAHLADGGVHVEVMARSEIERIRDRSQNVQNAKKWNKVTPWDTDEEQMWIKTVLRRICKFLPKSVELVSALALDALAARGNAQSLDLSDVIEGDYASVVNALDHDGEDGEGGDGGDGSAGDDAGSHGTATATPEQAPDSGAAGAHPSPAPQQATAASESGGARRGRGTSQPLI